MKLTFETYNFQTGMVEHREREIDEAAVMENNAFLRMLKTRKESDRSKKPDETP